MITNRQDDDFLIHANFVDDLKSITADKRMMDEFLELYRKDFDITGEELMETFIGLESIQSDTSIRINMSKHFSTGIRSMILELSAESRLLVNLVSFSPRMTLLSCLTQRSSLCYRSLVAKLQFAVHGSDMTSLMLSLNLGDFARLRAQLIGQLSDTLCVIFMNIPSSNFDIPNSLRIQPDSMIIVIRIGPIMRPVDLPPAISSDTTEHLFCGNPSFIGLFRCQLWKLNTN
jgi:hypothetical protein